MTHAFYRTRRPGTALRSCIARYWAYDGYAPSHAEERVMPTGTLELIIAPAGERLTWRDLAGQRGTCSGAVLCGPRVTAFDVPTRQQRRLVGVHFRPGGAWPVLGLPMEDLVDALVPPDTVLGRDSDALLATLAGLSDTEACFTALDRFFVARLSDARSPHPAVQFALRRIAIEGEPIGTICREAGLSHRRLVEVFRREVGPTPREFARVHRLQRALRAPFGEAADAALRAGFADQSHWGLECRKLLQMTPGRLLALRRQASDVPRAERGQMVPIG